jgi:phosphohistidine phosphatase SixA
MVEDVTARPGTARGRRRFLRDLVRLTALGGVAVLAACQTWINRDGVAVTRANDQRLEWEGDRQLVEALRRGGQLIYVRHGATDASQRDSDPNNLANCATQRNLTEAGRQQARAIGEALKTLEVPVGRVLTSEYCRAREFARLMFGKEADVEPSLVLPDTLTEQQRAQNTEALKRVLAQAPQSGANTFLVSHSTNIRLASAVDLPAEGGAAVFRAEPAGPTLQARVLADEWSVWARALGRR